MGLGADGDDTLAVVADVDVVPGERAGGEGARAVAVEPLFLVEDEAERSDEMEVVRGDRVERLDVGGQLGVDPTRTESRI